MNTFDNIFIKLLCEMARPNKLIPSLIGPKLFNRYEELIKRVNYYMKYGKDLKNNFLIDIDGNVANGLGDEILQYRKYSYFFFMVNKFNENIPQTYESYVNADKKAYSFLIDTLKKKDITATSQTKFLIGNALSILKNKKYFLSSDFEKELLNPTNIATYMNVFRVKNDKHKSSFNSAKKREKIFDMGIADVHGALANTRDERTKINRREAYDKRTRSFPTS